MLREHVPQETRIHYIITRGGAAPNIVPDFAEAYYYARQPNMKILDGVWGGDLMVNDRSVSVDPDDDDVFDRDDEDMDLDDDEPSLHACAARLVELGSEYVLVTGTHEATTQVVNTLYAKSGIVRSDTWPRLPYQYHGSGCTLASAIAAMLANGLALPEAVREAQDFTWHALEKAYRPGMGQHLPDRLFWARDERDARTDDEPSPEAPEAVAVDGEPVRRRDARGTH